MEFNEKLQQLRTGKNLTQEQLAEQLYVSRTAISKWGKRGVHLDKDTTSIATLTFAQPIQPEGWITRKGGMRPVEGVAYRLFLWGFPKGATPPFGTRLCEAKCSVLYALSALP